MKRPLMGLSIALAAGIAVGWFDISWYLWIAAAIGIIIILKYWADSSYKYLLGLSVLFIVGFCRTMSCSETDILLKNEVCGRIYKIEEKENVNYLYVQNEQRKKILVIVKKEDENVCFFKGQKYLFEGDTEVFEEAGNPGQFDEASYYCSMGVRYRLWAKKYHLMDEGRWFEQMLRPLEDFRKTLCDFYAEYMSSEGNGILQAAVLGERAALDKDVKRYYQENGWMHLITTSGLHLSFVAMNVYKRLRKMTVRQDLSTIIAFVLMYGYGYMTNFGDSMYRAMGMMILVLMAKIWGRRTDGWTSLFFLGGCMLFLRPERIESTGFLLTFTAVGGMEFGKYLNKTQCRKSDFMAGFQENICIQTGIFVSTLPILLCSMYEIPVYGFFYNFFMIPFMSVIVPVSFGFGTCGVFNIPILKSAAVILLKIIDLMLKAVHVLPSKVLTCGCPENWQLALFVLGMSITIFLISRHKVSVGWILMMVSCCFLIFARRQTDTVIFMDVGQGDGICILTEDGHTFLVDGGSSDVRDVFQYRIEPLLKYYGKTYIDGWFLTHGDLDHVSGVEEAIELNSKIKRIFVTDTTEDEVLGNICTKAKNAGISVAHISAGDRIWTDSIKIDCLYPNKGEFTGDKNNDSMILAVKYLNEKQTSFLFAGDIEAEGESILRNNGLLRQTDILKVAHHGSKGSTTKAFLEAVCPKWAIISCGKKNLYGHPHKEVLERLKNENVNYLSTSNKGAIIVHMDDRTYTIYAYKTENRNRESD